MEVLYMAIGKTNIGGGPSRPPTNLITKAVTENQVLKGYQVLSPNGKYVIDGKLTINSALVLK